jgi:hypothetical protein
VKVFIVFLVSEKKNRKVEKTVNFIFSGDNEESQYRLKRKPAF